MSTNRKQGWRSGMEKERWLVDESKLCSGPCKVIATHLPRFKSPKYQYVNYSSIVKYTQ